MRRRQVLCLALLQLAAPWPAISKGPEWSAAVDGDDKKLVKVTVDLRSESHFARFSDVTCKVKFLDQKGKAIAEKMFKVTDEDNFSLLGGKVYVRSFPHGVMNASKAVGSSLKYTRMTQVLKK